MKSIFKHLFLISIVMLSSCSSDDSSNTEPIENYGSISAEITSVRSELTAITPFTVNYDIVRIHGLNCDRPVAMTVEFPYAVGTYTYNEGIYSGTLTADGSFFPCGELFENNSNDYSVISGTLIVTEAESNSVKGSFEFTAKDYNGNIRAVTNGAFNVRNEY